MRILVTGGAGFIGSNFVRWLLGSAASREVKRVVVLDALTYAGNLANLAGLDTDVRFLFVRGDIRDLSAVETLLRDEHLELLINFAAETHVDRSIVNPFEFVRTNVEGTQVLLECARKQSAAKFIQISTDEVYGSLGPSGRFTESSPIQPSSAYSASKAAADFLSLAAFKTHGFPVCVTRCSNNYGPFQFPEKFIPLFITNGLAGEPLPLYGDGKNIRSWLHVDDHSRAIFAVAKSGRPGETYNIGGAPESEKENFDVACAILRQLGKPESLIRRVEDRKGHDRRYAVDFSKIEAELGWRPAVAFEQGLLQTVHWYKENASWWQAVKTGEYQKFYELYYGGRL